MASERHLVFLERVSGGRDGWGCQTLNHRLSQLTPVWLRVWGYWERSQPPLLTVMYQGRNRRTRGHKKYVPFFYQLKLRFGERKDVGWEDLTTGMILKNRWSFYIMARIMDCWLSILRGLRRMCLSGPLPVLVNVLFSTLQNYCSNSHCKTYLSSNMNF